mmetsp:Transcript_23234/g.41100  ORF Transcript_23234/g.41100 Transcript_23234/m.41100 type:complete len:208 (-) Transcript_23234:628-1251(-)
MPTGKRFGSPRYDFGSNLPPPLSSTPPPSLSASMLPTAPAPCSMPVEAKPGGPSTSPAAYTPFTDVSRLSSTRTRFLSSIMTPASSSPSLSVFGTLPAANMYVSTLRVWPLGCFVFASTRSIVISLQREGGTLKLPTCWPKTKRTPDEMRSSIRVSAISTSTPTLCMAAGKLVSLITSVTSASKRAKILAYSMAIIPAPVMATFFGR